MKDTNFADDYPFIEQNTLSLKDDDPKWLETEHAKREISLELTIILHKERDAGKPDRVQPAVVVRIAGSGRQFARKIRAGLFAVELRILRRDDLPSTISLEPSIGPNQASGFGRSVFCLSD